MQLKHSFTVPTDLEQAWQVLLDIERIAPCMPGAAIDTVDGDDFTGTVKVRLGPIGLTYKGKASFIEKDATSHRAVIDAQGKDARGNGTAKARITATLTAQGSNGTSVDVVTDLNITGKPAQFGRGVMVDVGNKLIGQFAECLARKLSGSEVGAAGVGGPSPAVVEQLATADPATVERLAQADLEGAEQLGIADPDTAEPDDTAELADTAELGVSAPDADRSAVGSGAVDIGDGSPAPDQPAGRDVGLAEPGVAESGLAELGSAEPVSPDSPVAGPGLADFGAGTPAGSEAVVAVPGPAPGQAPVEPDTAAEAAPPAQAAFQSPAQSAAAQSPSPRPAVADVEPIDLLGSAGPAVAKRLAPVAVGAVLVLALLLRRRRRAAARLTVERARAEYRAAVKRWAEAERRAAIERRNLSRTALVGSSRPAVGWRAWPAGRSGGRPGAGRTRQAD